MLLFLRLFKDNQKWKVETKNKMDNPDEENIPLVNDKDYDDYNTLDTRRIDKT